MGNSRTIEQINRMIDKTKEMKIQWQYVNNNGIRWIRQDDGRLFTVTLQRKPSVVRTGVQIYYMTIQATNPNEIVLQINSSGDTEYLTSLRELFALAMENSRSGSSDIIDKLLDNI